MTSLTNEALDQFLAEDDGGPVVMLNLLRFKPGEGRAKYQEYLGLAGPVVQRLGAEILFAGEGLAALAAAPGQQWDAVALVRYPTRNAFISLLNDPEYQRADPVRLEALAEAFLQPLRPL